MARKHGVYVEVKKAHQYSGEDKKGGSILVLACKHAVWTPRVADVPESTYCYLCTLHRDIQKPYPSGKESISMAAVEGLIEAAVQRALEKLTQPPITIEIPGKEEDKTNED